MNSRGQNGVSDWSGTPQPIRSSGLVLLWHQQWPKISGLISGRGRYFCFVKMVSFWPSLHGSWLGEGIALTCQCGVCCKIYSLRTCPAQAGVLPARRGWSRTHSSLVYSPLPSVRWLAEEEDVTVSSFLPTKPPGKQGGGRESDLRALAHGKRLGGFSLFTKGSFLWT